MRVHFIAIGGSAMHNLAIALNKKGFAVSGSDDQIFEPSASRLARYGLLPAAFGWYPEQINKEIDAVILGMHARPDNPELLRAQQLGLKIYSYPEYIYEQSKDKLRVVIGGSHGKTTITSMILHTLQYHGQRFDYLVGAQLEGFETMVGLTADAPVIIIEGDEYLASPIDRRPKFHLYKANIGVISGIAWDHINVFPTFDSYVEQFSLFIDTIEGERKLIYYAGDETLADVVKKSTADVECLPYSIPQYEINNGITNIILDNNIYPLQVFGEHNLLNMQAAGLVCQQLGINAYDFYTAMATFKGAARRLELIGCNDKACIYKDFAHSPSKLKATVHAVKQQYQDLRLVACIELHTFSSLNKNFLDEYRGTMEEADEAIVFIDKRTFEHKKLQAFGKEEVSDAFGRTDLLFFDEPKNLYNHLKSLDLTNSNLLLMSSGNFGELDITSLKNILL